MHDWDVSTERAKQIQRQLRKEVRLQPLDNPGERVAGCDISFDRGSSVVYAAVVVLERESLEPIEIGRTVTEVPFPYIPTYLSFREAPALLKAYGDLDVEPDLLVCDGHGLAHPRRFGLASHLGVLLDKPTIGSAKNILVGSHDSLGNQKGSYEPLVHEAETVGAALRTRTDINPVYVSPGHRVDLESAVEIILEVSPKYKIPEPIRAAHREVNRMRRN